MHRFKRGAAMTGGSLVLAWLAFSAFVDKFGHVGAATKWMPKSWVDFIKTPDGVLFLVAAALVAVVWAIRYPHAPPDPRAILRASVRVTTGFDKNSRPFVAIRNIGELEAQHVTFDPLTYDAYPFQVTVKPVGSLAKGGPNVEVIVTVVQRSDVHCEQCTDAGHLHGFLVGLVRHHLHSTGQKRDYDAMKGSTRVDVETPMVLRYHDELRRDVVTKHRLEVGLQDGLPLEPVTMATWFNAEFETEEVTSVGTRPNPNPAS